MLYVLAAVLWQPLQSTPSQLFSQLASSRAAFSCPVAPKAACTLMPTPVCAGLHPAPGTAGMKALIRVTNADYTQRESAIPGAPTLNGSSSCRASWQTMAAAAALALFALFAAGL